MRQKAAILGLMPGMAALKNEKEINMICPNCGKEIGDGVQFCPSCGMKISENSENNSKENRPDNGQPLQYGSQKKAAASAENRNINASQGYQYQAISNENSGKKKKGGKKIIWILAVVGILVLLLAMCSSGGDSSKQTDSEDDVKVETTEENKTEESQTEESKTEESEESKSEELEGADSAYVLDLFTRLQDNGVIPYELNTKAKAFLREKSEYFPLDAEKGTKYLEGSIDYSIETKNINKNPDKFGDKLMMISHVQVVQIYETAYGTGFVSQLNIIDNDGNQYIVFYPGELPDVYDEDMLDIVVGLPLGTGTFDNTNGGSTWVVVLAGSYIEKDAMAESDNYDKEDHRGEFCGSWEDTNSQRCYMSIESDDGVNYNIEIDWSSSAWENSHWSFWAVYNDALGGLCYSGSRCEQVYLDNGDVQENYVYYDGSGMLYLDDRGQLHWDDYEESVGEQCLFVRDSYDSGQDDYYAGNTDDAALSYYILPYSDTMYYTREDLAGLSKEMLRLARNEVYARHGRLFQTEDLANYFNAQPWYYGYISAGDFDESVLNEYEKANLDLIKEVEAGL